MVEHHIENHLKASAMQGLHQVAKLVEGPHRIRARAVTVVGDEKGNGLIAPVIRPASRCVQGVKLKHRQQLHRRDTQGLEIGNFFNQAHIGSRLVGVNPRARVCSKAAHMQLVNHRIAAWAFERLIPFPVVGIGIHNHTSHGHSTGLTGLTAITRRHHQGQAIGIEEQILGIKALTVGRIPWAMHPVAIHLARTNPSHKTMPVVIGAVTLPLQHNNLGRLWR